ncbi:MAG: hypothetical protein ABI772_02220 [Bacteroidota bacterium]
MYSISDQQIAFILNDIRRNGVEMEDLQSNLLDHICCIIENQLEENGDFEQFYYQTVCTFYIKNLSEIEEETKALLNNKYYYTMKKIMFVSGSVSASLISIGILFKFMHWPGAGMLIVLGTVLFSLLFLPMLFTIKSKEKQNLKDKIILGTGSFIAILISLAILFKIMHWPGANMMGVISLLTMILLYIPLYFFSGIKNQDSKANTIITSILMVAGCGLFMALARAPYASRIMSIKDTGNYLRMEQIYQAEKKQVDNLKVSVVQKKEVASTGDDIIRSCDALKSDILEWQTGFKTVDQDFERKNALIVDGWVRIYFEDNESARQKLADLRKLVVKYNAGQNKADSNPVHAVPLDAIDFDSSEEKILCALNNLVQLQMIVLQNESASGMKR